MTKPRKGIRLPVNIEHQRQVKKEAAQKLLARKALAELKARQAKGPAAPPSQAKASQAKAPKAAMKNEHGKRASHYVINVQGLFQNLGDPNFDRHADMLLQKYHRDPRIVARIEQARKLRAEKIPIARRVEGQTKLPPPPSDKTKKPPGLCDGVEGDPFTHECWTRGIDAKLAPSLQDIAKGAWLCGGEPRLGPHQMVHTEAAKLIASKQEIGPGDRRGLLVWASTGSGKCFRYDTPILMHDGSIKMVQDVRVGEVVMGDDGGPRTVTSLGRGQEAMYEIVPSKGEPWGCNESHILVLRYILHKKITKTKQNTWFVTYHEGGGVFKRRTFETEGEAEGFAFSIPDELSLVEIELKDYLMLGSHLKHVLKMFRTGVDFPNPQEPCFDPYVLGAWLGDGSSRCSQITSADVELLNELQRRLEPYDMSVKALKQKYQFNMIGDGIKNPFTEKLREFDLLQNKHIPHHIKTGSRETRLEVLAGLLDTDGYFNKNCYEITQKNKRLADDIVFVARSLGFLATIRECEKSCMYNGEKKTGTYHRIQISGAGLEDIPVVLDRKKASPRRQIKNALHYGFKVEPKGWGDYYGFTIDGNHRFLLGDFTVTHNTVSALGIMLAFWHTPRKIFFVTTVENSRNNPLSEYAKNCLVYFREYADMVFGGKVSYMPPKELWTVKSYKDKTEFPGPDGKPRTFEQWCASEGANVISKRMSGNKIISFHVFAGATKRIDELKDEKGAVLIIDEAQNMFKPKAKKGSAEANALEYMAKHLPTEAYMKHSCVFPLTATPGDTADQIIELVNVVRPWGQPRITVRDFSANTALVRGLISYVDIRGDSTKYGSLADSKPINKYVPFEPRYFAAFAAEFGSTFSKGELRNLNAQPDGSKKFFAKSIVGGCILSANKVKPFFKGDDAGYGKLLKAKINGRTEVVFSEKMREIFRAIEATRGCQYLYVPDPNVLKATVDALQKHYGFERIHGDKLPTKDGKPFVPELAPGKRFFAFYPGTMDGVPGDPDQLKAVLNAFKANNNKYGERIKLFVGTVYEGLDMSWLQAVHLAAPLPTVADDDQAVGRALRYCGHDVSAKTVAVYRYFGVAPRSLDEVEASSAKQRSLNAGIAAMAELDERGINAHVFKDSHRRGKPMEDFMMCLRGRSIECEVNPEQGGLLGAIQFGEKTRCGVPRCDVKLDAEGRLEVPKHAKGTFAHGVLPRTLANHGKAKTTAPPKAPKPPKTSKTGGVTGIFKPGGVKPGGVKSGGVKQAPAPAPVPSRRPNGHVNHRAPPPSHIGTTPSRIGTTPSHHTGTTPSHAPSRQNHHVNHHVNNHHVNQRVKHHVNNHHARQSIDTPYGLYAAPVRQASLPVYARRPRTGFFEKLFG